MLALVVAKDQCAQVFDLVVPEIRPVLGRVVGQRRAVEIMRIELNVLDPAVAGVVAAIDTVLDGRARNVGDVVAV
jgi:hypothetical protein